VLWPERFMMMSELRGVTSVATCISCTLSCNRPARFAVPAKIDTQILFDGEGEEGTQECSDDEEALRVSYASVMGRLKVSYST